MQKINDVKNDFPATLATSLPSRMKKKKRPRCYSHSLEKPLNKKKMQFQHNEFVELFVQSPCVFKPITSVAI